MVCELAFQWELNTLEASNKIRYTKKTRLDMLASQVCMLEVGSIYMSLVLMLHNFCGGLLAGEMYSQHMV